MDYTDKLKGVLDERGRLTQFPAKRKKKLYALCLLASQFEPGRVYTEREVNDLLNEWTTFGDPATLRRELFDYWFLYREKDGSGYRLEEPQPDAKKLGLE